MNLGGFIGKILYDNVDEQTANILQLGELIGVGKSCVFGLGKIKLEEGDMNGYK
jgi:CRISPR/Cas system endoribonuclease Cas6 (RAMP superfamily)